jgi:signal transduction histidine kinase
VGRRHAFLVDAAVPVLAAAVILVATLAHSSGHGTLAVIVGLAAAASLWARRRAPSLTLVISGALVALLFHLDHTAGAVAVIAPAVALYSLALTRGRRTQAVAAIVALAAVILADTLQSGRPSVLQTLAHVLLVAIPLLGAEAMRNHRSYLSLLKERLELSERTREQEAERRAEQERMRIARELHDVVAHTLTGINVKAGAAAERLEAGEGRAALEEIELASHEAIGELRGILGVLRDPDGAQAPLAPAPGVEQVSELVARAREQGPDVQLQLDGTPPQRLSETASLAAYRIVQESLTNARRHAPGAAVRIAIRFDTTRLSMAIENGPGTGASSNGHAPGVGITGMLERAAAAGGTLRAGPGPGDGWRVDAELPMSRADDPRARR